MPSQIGGKPAWEDFYSQLQATFRNLFPGQYEFRPRVIGEDTYRVAITHTTGGRKQTPLYVDLTPGPYTDFGPSVAETTPSGSQWLYGAEVPIEEGGAADFKTPMEAFATYVNVAHQLREFYGGWQKALTNIKNIGVPGQVAGGVMMWSPNIHGETIQAQRNIADKVTLALGENVYFQDALQTISGYTQAPQPGSYWDTMRMYGFAKSDDNLLRMRKFGVGVARQVPGGSIYETQMDIIGSDVSKAAKHFNVAMGLREQVNVMRNLPGGGIEPARPGDFGEKFGYKRLDFLFPGETEPRNVLAVPNAFSVASTLFPGTSLFFDDPMRGYTTTFTQHEETPIKVPSMGTLPRGQFQKGVFEERDGGYHKIAELAGFRIEPGKSIIAGLYTYQSESGETITHPHRVSAGGSARIMTGEAELFISPGYTRAKGEPHPGLVGKGQDMPRDYVELLDPNWKGAYDPTYMQELRRRFPGEVRTTTKAREPYIRWGSEVVVGPGFKGEGAKTGYAVVTGLAGQQESQTVSIAGQQLPVRGITSEWKNPMRQFGGIFGWWSREQKMQFLEETFGGDVGTAMSGYVRGLDKDTPVSMAELTDIYNRFTGEYAGAEMSQEQLMNRMSLAMHRTALENPQYSLLNYDVAYSDKPQWVNYGVVSAQERGYISREAIRNIPLTKTFQEQYGPDYTRANVHEFLHSRVKFENLGDERFRLNIKQRGLFGPAIFQPTGEYMSGTPSLGEPELAAISRNFPELAKARGLHISQGVGATGYRPPHVRGWDELTNIFAYTMNRGTAGEEIPLAPPGSQIATAEQVEALRTGLMELGDKPTLTQIGELLQKTIPGRGSIIHPESGEIIPRTNVIEAVSEQRYWGEDITNVNRLTKYYPEQLSEWSYGGVRGDQGSKTSLFYDELKKILTSPGGQVPRYQFRRYSPALTGGRYQAVSGLGIGEMVVEEEQFKNMLSNIGGKQLGLKGEELTAWEERAYKQAQALGGLPGLWGRYPTPSKEGGAFSTRIMTPSMAKEKYGLDIKIREGFAGAIGVGSIGAFGDWDYDPMWLYMAAKFTRRGISMGGTRELLADINAPYASQAAQLDYILALSTGYGKEGGKFAGIPGGRFNVLAATMQDIFEDDITKIGRSGLTETTPEELQRVTAQQALNKQGMGKAYNLRRWMEAAATARGWDFGGIAGMDVALMRNYQEYLDLERSEFRKIENVMSSVHWSHRGAEGAPVMKAFTGDSWVELAGAGGMNKRVLRDIMSSERPEMQAAFFARTGEEMYALQGRMGKENPADVIQQLLTDPDYDISTAIGPTALMAASIRKGLGFDTFRGAHMSTPREGGEKTETYWAQLRNIADANLRFEGKLWTPQALFEENEVIRRTNIGFKALSYQGGPLLASERAELGSIGTDAPLVGLARGSLKSAKAVGAKSLGLGRREAQYVMELYNQPRDVAYTPIDLDAGAPAEGLIMDKMTPEEEARFAAEAKAKFGDPVAREQARQDWERRKGEAAAASGGSKPPGDKPPTTVATPDPEDDDKGSGWRKRAEAQAQIMANAFIEAMGGAGGGPPGSVRYPSRGQYNLFRDLEIGASQIASYGKAAGEWYSYASRTAYEDFGAATARSGFELLQNVEAAGGLEAQNEFIRRNLPAARRYARIAAQINKGGTASRVLGPTLAAGQVGETLALRLQRFEQADITEVSEDFALASQITQLAKARGIKDDTPLGQAFSNLEKAAEKLEKRFEEVDKTVEEYGTTHRKSLRAMESLTPDLLRKELAGVRAESARLTEELETAPDKIARGEILEQRIKLRAQEQGLALQLQQTQPGPEAMGRAMHGLLGGWNLMYMGRLMQLGTGQFQTGYQEYERFATALESQNIRRYGVDAIDVRRNAEMEYQQALIRAGGGMYRGMRMAGAQIAGSGIQPFAGAALTGVGLTALANFVGPRIAQIGITTPGIAGAGLEALGTGIGANAMRIGGVAAAGAMAYNIYQQGWAQPEEYFGRAVAGYAGGGGLSVAGNLNMMGATARDIIESGGPVGAVLRHFFTNWTPTVSQAKGWGQAIKKWGKGELGDVPWTPEIAQKFSQYAAMADIPELEHLSPELKAQLIGTLAPAGYGVDTVRQMGTAIQAGLPVLETTQGLTTLAGVGPLTQSELTRRAAGLDIASLTEAQMMQLGAGSQFLSRISGIQRFLQDQNLFGTNEIIRSMQASNIVGGANEAQFLQQMGTQIGYQQLGLTMPVGLDWQSFARDQRWSPELLYSFNQQQALAQQALQFGTGLMGMGIGRESVDRFTGMAGQSAQAGAFFRGMASLSPIWMARTALETGAGTPAIFNELANVDIGLGGNITGLPWGTTSLQRGAIRPTQMADMIWGSRWGGTEWGEAAVRGIETPSGQVVGGMRGLQWLQYYNQQESAQSRLGLQAAQIALQERYQPMFWAIEDRQRDVAYRQAQWGFEYQQRQFDMQGQQFRENMAFQQRQQLQQRAWTQQDWLYQDQTRSMQWGWTQEDFQENVRFMTGRQRRLAERQMERQTIMHGMEGDRIETMRDRQKEMWRMEDERHDMTMRHNQEQRELLQENMDKNKEFYEENKRLQDEMIQLRREYWKEQIELQKQSLAISEQEMKKNKEIQEAIMELSDVQEDYNGKMKVAQELQVETINSIIEGLNHIVKYAPEALMSILDKEPKYIPDWEGGKPSGGGGPSSPLDEYRTTLPQQTFNGGGGAAGSVTVYIGNERLGEFVVDAFTREVRVV